MIKIYCDICKGELEELGALLFSPPETLDCFNGTSGEVKFVGTETTSRKYHICVDCFEEEILKLIS